jgi:hypothetical protein
MFLSVAPRNCSNKVNGAPCLNGDLDLLAYFCMRQPKGSCSVTAGMLAARSGQADHTISLVLGAADQLLVVLVPK